jgi:hypothetical protein
VLAFQSQSFEVTHPEVFEVSFPRVSVHRYSFEVERLSFVVIVRGFLGVICYDGAETCRSVLISKSPEVFTNALFLTKAVSSAVGHIDDVNTVSELRLYFTRKQTHITITVLNDGQSMIRVFVVFVPAIVIVTARTLADVTMTVISITEFEFHDDNLSF